MDLISEVIIEFIRKKIAVSSKEIHQEVSSQLSYASTKRLLIRLLDEKLIVRNGQGKATKYSVSPTYELFVPLNLATYFDKEIDERIIKNLFNFDLIEGILPHVNLFTSEELSLLENLHLIYTKNITTLSEAGYKKELERLAIDLSWKSSQIEGNTYSLLETERLIKDQQTANGKKKEEATMLLNHKKALDFIIEHPDYIQPLTILSIEDIHSILIEELDVDRNIRTRRVGISGTNYIPLDNEFQIRDALRAMCTLVNAKKSVFEKAFLVLILLSYIQAFGDGNKRTARIVSNAILINNGYCPISFRTVDSIEYKKAMLVFYEQNNITAFKKIFIEQYKFAVKTYF